MGKSTQIQTSMSKTCQQTLANKNKETTLQSRDVNHNQLKHSAMGNIHGVSIKFDFSANVSILGDGASAITSSNVKANEMSQSNDSGNPDRPGGQIRTMGTNPQACRSSSGRNPDRQEANQDNGHESSSVSGDSGHDNEGAMLVDDAMLIGGRSNRGQLQEGVPTHWSSAAAGNILGE